MYGHGARAEEPKPVEVVSTSQEVVFQPDGLYIISVAARLLQVHPQTLRKYERLGLVRPSRTTGMLRMYSEEDLIKIRLIRHLAGEQGLNLAGIQAVLALLSRFLEARRRLEGSISLAEARSAMDQQLQGFLQDLGLTGQAL